MHRTDIRDDTGQLWYIFHNGDWSGDAMVGPADAPCDETVPDIVLPASVIKNACRQVFVHDLQDAVEAALDKFLEENEES